MNEIIEQKVIDGCIRNDRRSQEKLYKQLFPALFCLCRRYFRNDHEAIESVNDGMLKVYKNINSYQPAKGALFNWVYTIVRNTALDKLKLTVPLTQQVETLSGAAESGNGEDPLRALEAKDLYSLLDHLNPATRLVCSLFYIDGYAIKDIVSRLDISPGTVKWHLSESRRKLKDIFEKQFNTRP
ncbi:MAG: sigma-70 family RNA polymerase sigma factor [Bacteroidota bacterium]|nr:sigma-70 family RNA polymerase sigma factor [Bacteroidota bacterium]MDP4216897.1 sigma-70 family RNA polymerase sigma factor [Bacteroidota bacterium]MDP4247317.1 sigma-70 family RNA polymerase sigma factor [Bacteroidota bacterium]MDP4253169.1 sigma-70 family RNA polymerase sigma factor [Bacteroidota bacterium]MDP4257027.1 sigma-70 family RNA polymerase sigma factor [Bacteroidota bacterium]